MNPYNRQVFNNLLIGFAIQNLAVKITSVFRVSSTMHFKSLIRNFWWIPFLVSSKQEELCGVLNSRTIYLQLGEQGDVVHHNQTWFNKNLSRCSMELVTCPSCSIQISINQLDLPQMCIDTTLVNASTEQCPCGALTVWEPSGHTPPTRVCSLIDANVFTSSTRSVGISFDLLPQNWTSSFSLTFIAQRNQNFVNGAVGQQGFLTSPNFPSLYPRDFGIEHILSCSNENCIINLIFTDFLISPTSLMEFYDSDGKPLQLVSGLIARPKPIQSSGPSLVIRFFGNGGTSMGYKATYKFLQNSSDVADINTECGGEVDNLGGTIYMTGLLGFYDCIWIIQPAATISHFKTHIYLKIVEYPQGNLSLRHGLTSESRLIETFTEPRMIPIEHVASVVKGFYISFRGNLLPDDKLVIAYAAFAYMDCLTGIDLLCGNKRCISIQLMCDSIDNCGDNSDETGDCKPEETEKISGQYWWPVRGTGTGSTGGPGGVLLSLGAALAGAALLLAAALCHIALRVRSPPPSHAQHHMDHTRTIAHLLNIGELEDRDDPPTYEPPPEYNQVVKPTGPRRKHSTQRLIERDSSTHRHSEDETSEPSSSLATETKKQFVSLPTDKMPEMMNSALLRIPDSSPPVSLDTTGYIEPDLGLSLTLSTSSHNNVVNKMQNLRWLSTASSKHLSGPPSTSNMSAVSFDTLNSTSEHVYSSILPPRLTKSLSQDDILWLCSNFNSFTNNQMTRNKEDKRPSQSQRSLDDKNLFEYSPPPPAEFQNEPSSSTAENTVG